MLPPAQGPDICSLCNGTGWKAFQDAGVERVARCDCWRAGQVDKMLREAAIPKKYDGCDLDNFQTSNDTLVRALKMGRNFAEKFPVVEAGLLFYGPPGVGKSHLCSAILRRVVQRCGTRAYFCESKEFLRLARAANNSRSDVDEMDVLAPVLNAELLVFDDLGSGRTSEWVDETLNMLVNVRYNDKRLTIFATNHPPVEADDKSLNDTLEERVGARVFSRLHEMCEFVSMTTVDYRQLPPNPSPEEFARLDKKGRKPNEAGLPTRSRPAHAHLKRGMAHAELKWSGGRGGNK